MPSANAQLASRRIFADLHRCYGIGLKLFGFIPEPVFTFIPESCSESSRTVRNHPGIAFILPRIPQQIGGTARERRFCGGEI
jgi:hypothetical protein